ncbi:MAG: transporter substrate-binding domain-containing protein [Bacteroidetes bacterium]|nr:transporter substrate-binding domain-containing protein [Bacteroidota bacterium]MBU1114181.1 transporter substrate-binding domain-containing protein [Bacteroidota bacterium]MBU1796943.1 transporter substrate-binding domain-containing protein [Bacteroidota bacterium]
MRKIISILFLVLVLVACSKENEKINETAQLKNKKIAVLTGSAGDIAARKVFPNAKYFDFIASADAAYNVKIGKIDAFIFDKSVLVSLTKKDNYLKILSDPVANVEIAIALSKENNSLLNEINNALEELRNDGSLEAMKEKWIDSQYKTVPELPVIQNDSKNGKLKMGTCATVEPITFLYNNKITGFDIELSLKLGKILGKKIEIIDMNFESLISALKSGKIDFALSNFNVTEERKQYINFSSAYLINDISALVKK